MRHVAGSLCDLREKKCDVERIDRLQADTMVWYTTVWFICVVQWCGPAHPVDLSLGRRTMEN